MGRHPDAGDCIRPRPLHAVRRRQPRRPDFRSLAERVGPYSFYREAGLLRTADGGATWTYVDLPNNPDTNGIVTVQNLAAIGPANWIACGTENAGSFQGVGGPST